MLRVDCLALAGLLAVAGAPACAQSWKPERTVELIVGSSAGTGTDRVARLMERIWREKKMMDVWWLLTRSTPNYAPQVQKPQQKTR